MELPAALLQDQEPQCLLIIAGTVFQVDVSNEWIYERDNPANFIPFSQLEEDGRDFRMIYDPVVKNIFTGTEEDMVLRDDLKYVVLKELKWLPGFGYSWSADRKNTNSLKK